MKFYSLIIILASAIVITLRAQVVVGYINGNYASYSHIDIDYSSLTHIAHAFVIPNSDGSLRIDSWFLYPQLISEAHKNDVKVLAAVGGYGQSDGFAPMAASETARAKFIQNIINFCTTHGYDGVDLDWEYPKAADKSNFVKLVSELRQALNSAGIPLLTAAIPSADWNNAYDLNTLKNYFDWFGIMTYDFYGPWESKSGHTAALYSSAGQYSSADRSMKYYLDKGVPAEKLCMGMPFGGYLLNTTGLFQNNSSGSSITYVAANDKIAQGWEYKWDDVSKAPYLQNPAKTQLITYDDTTSIKLKCDYIRRNNLKGTIVWKIGKDFSGGKTPLLGTLGKYLINAPTHAPVSPELNLPSNGSEVDSISIKLQWNSVDSATSYNLQLSMQSDFSTLAVNKSGINFTNYIVNNLLQGKIYYWRASASNIAGTGEWSSVFSFSTNNITAVDDDETLLSEFSLSQNYPNPFNPTTTIKYEVGPQQYVSLIIFDILGNEIATLVNGEKLAGSYEVVFDGNGLSSGIYFYKIKAGNFTETKKFILMK